MNPDLFRTNLSGITGLQVDNLHRFRREIQEHVVTHNGHTWKYIKAGTGKTTLLILPGILGTAESAWQLISRLSKYHTVIAPNYPPVDTNKAIAEGLDAILRHETIDKPVVYGGSYGGFVAQVFVRCYPHKVEKLILSHTTTPNRRRGHAVRVVSSLADWAPMPLLRTLMRGSLSGLMRTPDRNLRRAVRIYFRELARGKISREHIASTYKRVADYDTQWIFSKEDMASWPGKTLVLISEDDPLTPPHVRAALLALYPKAAFKLFSGSGHLSSILKENEFVSAIEEFLIEA